MDVQTGGPTRLTFLGDVPEPSAVVLMLHGGAVTGHHAVSQRNTAWWRSHLLQRAITPGLAREGVSTALLRFTVRGWNGDGSSPVSDASWALGQIAETYADVPVVMIGHSMGARTAVHAAHAANVRGVIGVAPWLPADDPVESLGGRSLVCAHGSADRITSPRATRAYLDRAATVAHSARYVDMGPIGHYMLRRSRHWETIARQSVLDVLAEHR